MSARVVSVSVVSHGHGNMVEALVEALVACPSVGQIILTLNVPEPLAAVVRKHDIHIIANPTPRGFGANHNAAFRVCDRDFFCPLNPDIEFDGDPFAALIERLSANRTAALAAPAVVAPDGRMEDSLRPFPSVRGLVRKALVGDPGRYPVAAGDPDFYPEWVAGMFMLFRSAAYRDLGGFDERFFLYYEDVDVCARAWKAGMPVLACPSVAVVHDARRDSHRRFAYLRWHATSMLRYFVKYWGRLPDVPASGPVAPKSP